MSPSSKSFRRAQALLSFVHSRPRTFSTARAGLGQKAFLGSDSRVRATFLWSRVTEWEGWYQDDAVATPSPFQSSGTARRVRKIDFATRD